MSNACIVNQVSDTATIAGSLHHVRSVILLAITSAIAIYGLMFGTGGILYGEFVQGAIWLLLAIASGSASVVLWQRLPG